MENSSVSPSSNCVTWPRSPGSTAGSVVVYGLPSMLYSSTRGYPSVSSFW